MASNYLAILADIKTKMETVTDIGKVNDYYRWNKDASKFLSIFTCTPSGGNRQVRGWEITRVAATEGKRGIFFRYHRFRLAGYMTLKDDDETDKIFQVLVDDVCEVFRSGGVNGLWEYRDGSNPNNSPVQVNTIDVRTYGGALCHYAEIVISITEKIEE